MLEYYLLLFVVAICTTWWVFKKVLKIALMKNIVDIPDARKLQKTPVPVLGGAAVLLGMIAAMSITRLFYDSSSLFAIMGVMVIMLSIGIMDDILSLTPKIRVFIEILIILLLMFVNNYSLNDFHGLWGIDRIPDYVAIPLTIFACVGIINAINLIDGVNGLSSGYCIIACLIFATVFLIGNDRDAASMAIISIGALLPFFSHNVFGRTSKMFIGDGGTLLMGTILSSFVLGVLNTNSPFADKVPCNFGLIPFVLSVLAIPVFDCLRVMIVRIFRGTSPFYPDKTHLHHLLFDVGFSHVGTTGTEIILNLLVTGLWYLSYRLGASIELQLYIVIFLGLLFTFGLYSFVRKQQYEDTRIYHHLQRLGKLTHVGHTSWFERFRTLLDKGC